MASQQVQRSDRTGVIPLVSVVVPNFQHRRFLPERMATIFAQTCRNVEVIFLDDASRDGSLDYIRSLESPFPLRIVANETNSGSVFRQWHRGVVESRGEFVWIAESDDSCRPDLLEKLLAVAVPNPRVGLAYAQSSIVNEDGAETGSFLEFTDAIDGERWRRDYVNSGRDEAARYLVVRNTIPNASACLFRRTALIDADLPSIALKVCGDWLAYARICERHDVAFVAEHLNFYRRHGTTVREAANRDGTFMAETTAVQRWIAERFAVSVTMREMAARSAYRELLHLMKRGVGGRTFVDDGGILTKMAEFDPRVRERLAGEPVAAQPSLRVHSGENGSDRRVRREAYDSWRWSRVRFADCRGAIEICPLERNGLVAVRRIRLSCARTGEVRWSAETSEEFRQIEIGGDAQRVGSGEALEIFVWGPAPVLRIPAAVTGARRDGYDLELEIRMAGCASIEPPFPPRAEGQRHLLFLMPHVEPGGADRFNLDLIGQLTRRFGWRVTVVTTRRAPNSWAHAIEALTPDVFHLPRFLPVASYADFLRFLVESRKTDVLFLSHSWYGYGVLPWLKSQFPNLPVVDAVHIVMKEWKSGGYPQRSVECGTLLDATVAVSEDLRSWLVDHGRDAARVSVSHLGVDPAIWRRSPEAAGAARMRWALGAEWPVILFAGRLCDQKQPRLLRPLVDGLRARGCEFLLAIAGDGPDRGWLEKNLVAQHPEHVRLLGLLSTDELRTVMAAADILVLPSESEGLALVLFEALSMEVVPVATQVGGQAELVSPECGVLVPPGAGVAESMVDAVATLLRDPVRRGQMARAGRERVEEKFTLDAMGERINGVLIKAIAVRRAAAPGSGRAPAGVNERSLAKLSAEIERDEEGISLWPEVSGRGKEFPGLASRLAKLTRALPVAGPLASAIERRYGERIGRAIMRWR